MTTELRLLLASLVVYALYLGAQSLLYRWQHGIMYAQTARDDEAPAGPLLGRAERALKNYLETWPAFIILAFVAHLADPGDPVVFWGAVVWLAGRVLYLPLYLMGVFAVRSLVWVAAASGLFVMFFAVLF
ncbi:MAG: MAPEG family protein [Devosia sp.]